MLYKKIKLDLPKSLSSDYHNCLFIITSESAPSHLLPRIIREQQTQHTQTTSKIAPSSSSFLKGKKRTMSNTLHPRPATMSRTTSTAKISTSEILERPDSNSYVININSFSSPSHPLPGIARQVKEDVPPSLRFLHSCGNCWRSLGTGRDIYIYKGDTAFCSQECREQHIRRDDRDLNQPLYY